MRILVTGADGFIGSHLAARLEHAGHDVLPTVYGRPPRGRELRIDLTRLDQLPLLPREVQAIVHAAGKVDPHGPRSAMHAANVTATENLLAYAAGEGVQHFMQLSSVAVYGPLALGEDIGEDTLRLGLTLGLPYMRTKALAERAIEQSGVPYTLLRPPVVLGRGDTVISRGFRDALRGKGVPLVPGAGPSRRVSLALIDGLAERVRDLVESGPLGGPVHAVDAELTIGELAALYALALGHPCRFASISWIDALRARDEVGRAWLIASTRFGQHYRRERRLTESNSPPISRLESAIESGLSSLQGRSGSLF